MEYKNNKTANRRRYKSRYHSPHNYKTKRSKSQNRAAIIIAIATFLVIASLVLVFTFGDDIYSYIDSIIHPPVSPTEAQVTEAPTMAPTAAITEAPTEAPTEVPTKSPTADVKQTADFERLIAAASLNAADLSGSQMIFAESSGTSATVYTYEKNSKGVWKQKFSPIQGYVGEGGAAQSSVPDDSVTPMGTYNIEYAMGTNDDPGTALTYYPISYGMRWITDPSSINYNRMIDGDATYIDFEQCQELHEYTVSYPYAIIFDYNRNPVDSSQGCAKFLHVGYAPTYGGIGIPEQDLYNILLWLDPDSAPTISIF